MGVVQRLSEALSNQIAAGEVVERPASAAKELVENALDAGARRIDIRLEDGGRRRLEVVDDGSGMSREDALLALERHTTSKLRTSDDLFNIRTFGFRGEALSSIASVSRFTLTTRRPEDLAATRIVIEGGRVVSVEEAGAPAGTRIEVVDLFFNVPARLKFLKTRATELGHITDWLTRLGLVNPAVSFNVTEDGKSQLRADSTSDLRERIAALLGRDLFDALYPVEGGAGEVKVKGFAAGPQRANNTSREIFTFVNGRFVRDRNLQHAVARAYDGVLPIGRQPACVLFVELPPSRVDVNVHPQKLEVRFADSRSVYDAVAKSLTYTLSSSPWLTKVGAPAKSYSLKPSETPQPSTPSPAPFNPQQERVANALDRYTERNLSLTEALFSARPLPASEPPVLRAADSFVERFDSLPPLPPLPRPVTESVPSEPKLPSPPVFGSRLNFGELRFLGQVHRTYLICESPEGLVLIDQHAAHERVLYERYRKERAGVSSKGQPFLVPITMDLAPSDAKLVEAALEELTDLGFEIDHFGGNTYSLKAAPPELMGSDLPRTIKELSAEVRTLGKSVIADSLEESLLTRMACHTAVRAGHSLDAAEALELLRSLDGTAFNAQCPHGRPVVVRFDSEALKEMFGRTYEGTPKASAREKYER